MALGNAHDGLGRPRQRLCGQTATDRERNAATRLRVPFRLFSARAAASALALDERIFKVRARVVLCP